MLLDVLEEALTSRLIEELPLTVYKVNSTGDWEMAVAMLDEALAISTELGMRPLMERVLSRQEILKS